MLIKGKSASIEAARSQTWVENESFPIFIPDFFAVTAKKSGREEDTFLVLPTFDP